VLRDAVDLAPFITVAELRQKLAVGLLRWPYAAFRRDGHEIPASEYTEKRQCVGVTHDFVAPTAARTLLEQGATVELRRLTDWHRPTRTLAEDIERSAPVAVSVGGVLRPLRAPDAGTRSGRDAVATIVVQLSGQQRWHNDAPQGRTVTLVPGDVLHLPAGHAGTASTCDEASLHVAVELLAPAPEDFVAALRQHFADTNPDLIQRYHLVPSAIRSAAVRDRLLASVRELPEEAWQAQALALTRKRTG
jgi:ribosomal protein L16 Arg81 hydroxylase